MSARPSAVHAATSSSVSGSALVGDRVPRAPSPDGRRPGQVDAPPTGAERDLGQHVPAGRRARAPAPMRRAGRRSPPAPSGTAPSTATASAPRSGDSSDGLGGGRGGAPARRRSSAARVGPRNGASARPRPSSSATMAASTPDASGAPPSSATRSSRQPDARDGGVELRGPLGVVELRRRRCGAEPVDDLRGRVAQRLLLGREADVHQSASGREQRRRPLVAQRAAQHLARRQPRDGVDDHDVAQVLVGRERVGDELLELAVGDRPVGVELHGGHRHLAGPLVGEAEHRAVEHRGVAVQHRLDLGRRHLEAVDLDHLLGAVGEVHPALGLEPADVAGAVPAVGERLGVGLVGQVAGHHRRAAGLDLADLARRRAPRRCRGRRPAARRRAAAGRPSRAASASGRPPGCTAITGSSLAP